MQTECKLVTTNKIEKRGDWNIYWECLHGVCTTSDGGAYHHTKGIWITIQFFSLNKSSNSATPSKSHNKMFEKFFYIFFFFNFVLISQSLNGLNGRQFVFHLPIQLLTWWNIYEILNDFESICVCRLPTYWTHAFLLFCFFSSLPRTEPRRKDSKNKLLTNWFNASNRLN